MRAFFLPPACYGCGVPLAGTARGPASTVERLFCPACRRGVRLVEGPACPCCGQPGVLRAERCPRCRGVVFGFDRAAAGAWYTGTIRRLVLRLKFGGWRPAAYPLSCAALAGARRALRGAVPDCVVAVPLHPARRRQRGFNQAAELAVLVSEGLGVPYLEGVVGRTRNTPPQGRGGGGSRRRNVREAFAPLEKGWGVFLGRDHPGRAVQGCHVLLVDDVLSTGATLDHCGRALRAAGARHVTAAAAAT